jgi:hypothetical protein
MRSKDQSKAGGSSKSGAKRMIAFRLEPDAVAKLAELAKARGETVGIAAKRMLVESLGAKDVGQGIGAIRADLDAVRESLAEFRRAMAQSVVGILVDAGKAEIKEAKAFVHKIGLG